MNIIGIYKIQSQLKPKRTYIGSSINIGNRWRSHLSELRLNKHANKKLQNHYNKYGESDLMFSILLGCDKEYIIANEQFFIDTYKPWFNLRQIADSNSGLKRSQECRNKLSISHIGHIPWNKGKKMNYTFEQREKHRIAHCGKTNGIPLSEERKKKISIANVGKQNNLGNKLSEKTKQKISMSNKGKKHPIEQNRRHSEMLKGRKQTEEHNRRVSEARKGIIFTELHKQHIKDAWLVRKLKTVNSN